MASTKVPSELIADLAITGSKLHTALGNTGVTANSSGLHIGQDVATSSSVQFQTVTGSHAGTIASATTGTTQANTDNSAKIATTAFVTNKITELIGGAPSTLNDLNELAAAINDDANYNSTLTSALATKAPIASPTFTGTGRMNGDWVVGAATGEDKFVIAPQAAGSGTILISYNDAGNAYEPLKVDFETLDLRTSGVARISIAGNGDIDLGDTTVKADGQLLVNLTASDVGASVNAIEADGGFRFRNGNWGIKNNDGSYETWLARSLTGNKTIYGEKLTVDVGNSRVGINTTSPDRTLDVKGSVQFSVNNSSHETFVFSTQGVDEAKQIMKNAANVSTIVLNTNGASYVTGGSFGIGTASPGDISLKVHSNDSDDYIAIFKQTHASNLGTVQIDTPSDSNARPSRLDFARGGVNKWKTGMVYGDTSNGWGLSDATGSGTALQQTRFLVQPGGNVGIGTTAPGEKLEVDGIIEIKRTSDHPAMRFSEVVSGSATTRAYMGSGDWAINGGDVDDFGISGSGTGDLILGTNAGVERMRIQNSTGNVGIGIANPPDKLHVLDGDIGIDNSSGRRYRLIAETDGTFTIRDQDASRNRLTLGTNGYLIAQSEGQVRLVLGSTGNATNNTSNWIRGNSGELDFNSASAGFNWEVTGAKKMILNSSGNLGVGDNVTPGVKVDIYGPAGRVGLAGGGTGSPLFYGKSDTNHTGEILQIMDKNNVEQLHMSNAGDVGIDTTSPNAKLEVSYGDNLDVQRWSYRSARTNFYLNLNTNIPVGGVVQYRWDLKNNGTNYPNILVMDRGRIGMSAEPQTRTAGKLLVYGTNNANEGIAYRNSGYSEVKNIVTNQTVASSHRYWHVKTNIRQANDNIMFKARFHGYAYGNSGNNIDVTMTGYNYTPNQTVINSVVNNQGTGSHTVSFYYSTDSRLVLVLDMVGGYYTGCALDWCTPSPAGHSHDIEIAGNAMSANATGEF